jgi:hypothetical protein
MKNLRLKREKIKTLQHMVKADFQNPYTVRIRTKLLHQYSKISGVKGKYIQKTLKYL